MAGRFSPGGMAQLWQALTRADLVLIGLLGIGTTGSFLHQQFGSQVGAEVVIEMDGVGKGRFPLGPPRKVIIEGVLGISEVEIGPDGAHFSSAPCPHGICLRQGWIRRQGETVACVPNRLILRIVGSIGETGMDAVSR
jgi:hypothetical protein